MPVSTRSGSTRSRTRTKNKKDVRTRDATVAARKKTTRRRSARLTSQVAEKKDVDMWVELPEGPVAKKPRLDKANSVPPPTPKAKAAASALSNSKIKAAAIASAASRAKASATASAASKEKVAEAAARELARMTLTPNLSEPSASSQRRNTRAELDSSIRRSSRKSTARKSIQIDEAEKSNEADDAQTVDQADEAPKFKQVDEAGRKRNQLDEEQLKKKTADLRDGQRMLKRKRDEFEMEFEKMRAELDKRETAIKKKEGQLSRIDKQLDKRLEAIQKKETAFKKREQETNDLALSLSVDRTQEAMTQLEEQWTCVLCYDIMACPANLTPAQCGHTFCALCILKWFFTHLHDDCGGWHFALECPLCRTVLPVPPEVAPRPMYTCPFSLNRLADTVLTDLIDGLRGPDNRNQSTGSGKGKKKAVDAGSSISDAWNEGGASRNEWKDRDRRGREELQFVVNSWTRLTQNDMQVLKGRLAPPANNAR
ncbi:uncharacterized protein LAESUDRAFT_756366 [Laetiporus sulphureus 93-53]|uniref:RING-type domain-containing protein n=1 Tax=Laetiporus sulphureus 93-53 TaxID=1314785 RepID=A0A165GD21_9APHY|nr:uncharacterized protein LAESUDRAFT_756366 [Laetiporus sulphureus 93-53]KZT10182.1 hypothetical protein LAESUDRAFT_756366 [Laetiporus sulphureus 93-53]